MVQIKAPSPGRVLAAAIVLAAAAGGTFAAAREVLPSNGALAKGLLVQGEPIQDGQSALAIAQDRAQRMLSRKVTFRFGEQTAVVATLAELDASVDVERLARRIAEIAHEGDTIDRLHAALSARKGEVDLAVSVSVGADNLASRLTRFKDENDTAPANAKLVFKDRTATPHSPGKYVDVYAALSALDQALLQQKSGDLTVELPSFAIDPPASSEVVLGLDISKVVSRFETKFGYVGGQQNRAGNIERAASQMDGTVLMPGEVVSFNKRVGPRSIENGFFTAPEIYKGEMREGIGGGTCQVAGTLHAAAFFGGLDVVERSPHSRPSGYLRMGLDATVVYPTTDLKLRNPYDFPIVVHAKVHKGTLTFELLGPQKPVDVTFASDTVAVAKFKRKVEEAPWLPEGSFKLKQKGITGYTIKRTRLLKFTNGEQRTEVTTDVYPATFEIYQVARDTDLSSLPPSPDDEGAPPPTGQAAPPDPPQAQASPRAAGSAG